MKSKRPINLNLFTISFPLAAIVSISHRISGVILFLMLPFFLWALNQSLASAIDFDTLVFYLNKPLIKFMIWLGSAALIFHLVAGIRHLLMDMGIGEELRSGKLSAQITFIVSAIIILLAGIWLW